MIDRVDQRIAELDSSNKDDKKKITRLKKDKTVLEKRLSLIDELLKQIGGQLEFGECKRLILSKFSNAATDQLVRYLGTGKRQLVAKVENLWDKYAVPSEQLDCQREQTLGALKGFLDRLGYSQ